MSGLINTKRSFALIAINSLFFYSCSVMPKPAGVTPIIATIESSPQLVVTSHYSTKLAGNRTASGEIYDPSKLTCAHKTLPFGTMVKVKNPKNSKIVIVKINDRGPFIRGRELDISNAAATKLAISGVQQVEMEILDIN